jgi:alkanesulfonate monooxygenase
MGSGAHRLLDAIDFGRYVIPIVREEVAKRDAEGRPRGPELVPEVAAAV